MTQDAHYEISVDGTARTHLDSQGDVPSRPEAIRRLLQAALVAGR